MSNRMISVFLLVIVMVLLYGISKIKFEDKDNAMYNYNIQRSSKLILANSGSNDPVRDSIIIASMYAKYKSALESSTGAKLSDFGTQNDSKMTYNISGKIINSQESSSQATLHGYSNNISRLNSGENYLSDNKNILTNQVASNTNLNITKHNGSGRTLLADNSNNSSKTKSTVRSFAPALPDEPGTSCGTLPIPDGLWLMVGFAFLYSLKIRYILKNNS